MAELSADCMGKHYHHEPERVRAILPHVAGDNGVYHSQNPFLEGVTLLPTLDRMDHRILAALKANGRMSTLDVAEAVGLSPTPCSRRIKRLEDTGVITGYTALIDPAALGLGMSVIVSVRLARQGPDGHGQFLEAIRGRSEISECLLVTGNIDYLLRVWIKDIPALREFVTVDLQSIPTVAETSTMLVVDDVRISDTRRRVATDPPNDRSGRPAPAQV